MNNYFNISSMKFIASFFAYHAPGGTSENVAARASGITKKDAINFIEDVLK
jgi:hypothetical protein